MLEEATQAREHKLADQERNTAMGAFARVAHFNDDGTNGDLNSHEINQPLAGVESTIPMQLLYAR